MLVLRRRQLLRLIEKTAVFARLMFPTFLHPLRSRCGGIASRTSSGGRAGPKRAERIASKPLNTAMAAFEGARSGGDATHEPAAVAGSVAAGPPTFWSAKAPASRTVPSRRRGGAPWMAVAKAGGGDSDSVLDKTAEFYGNSAPGAVAPKGAEKQDEAAVDYAVKGDWEKSVQLIQAMR